MANPEVKIILSAVDRASATIKNITGGTGKLNSAFKDLTGFSIGAAGGIALIGTGLQKGVQLVKDSVNQWVNYNKVVREMTQVTGLGSDEISRIIQVADDWGISIDEVRTSLAFMNKQGITPSIDTLAKMADEYVASTDKAAWAEKAVKTLGRGYQTLVPILAQGGSALRAATAGIADNMIATEESMKTTREYEVAVDNLGDAWTGVKNTIGNKVIPTLSSLMTKLNDAIVIDQRFTDAMDEATASGDKAYENDLNRIRSITDVEKAQVALNNAEAIHLSKLGLIDKGERDLVNTTGDLIAPTTDVAEAQRLYNIQIERYYNNNPDFVKAINDSKFAIEADNTAMDIINGTIKDYGDTLVEHIKIEAAFKLALGQITKAQYDQTIAVADLLIPLEEYSKLVQSGAIDISRLTQAIADGKVDRDELIAAFVAAGMSIEEARQKVLGLIGALDHMPKRYQIDVDLVYNQGQMPPPPGGAPIMNSKGANFVVPPGYNNDTFPMNVESGEHVIVIPKGGQTNNTSNFTMNVHTNAPYSTLMRDFNMMKAMAG